MDPVPRQPSAEPRPDPARRLEGSSRAVRALRENLRRMAPREAPVLLLGESGTGKEMVAKAIHRQSDLRDEPFVAINCSAIPENLLESELFGHEKGAFTDAKKLKKGMFELADKGTLFLDEIGDMSFNMQAKLLRALQEKRFQRVGGVNKVEVDIRIVASTNKNLEQAMKDGQFREDLYYRLQVVPITIPPLRDRPEDIMPLVRNFVAKFNIETDCVPVVIQVAKTK